MPLPEKQAVVVITTSSVEGVQVPLEIVQRRVAVPPEAANPVTPEVGEVGVVMVAVPDTTDHKPVPAAGVLPAKVAVVAPQAGVISVPALAVVGVADTVTMVVAAGELHAAGPLAITLTVAVPEKPEPHVTVPVVPVPAIELPAPVTDQA